jgi:hypothetical protein
MKQTYLHIVGDLEGQKRGKGKNRILEKTVSKNFPNLMKGIHVITQEAQRKLQIR